MTDSPAPRPPGLTSTPQALAGLAAYQDGAIVSRELVRKPTGTVTLFAFDAGQGLSEHTSPYDALVQVIEGAVTVTVAGAHHRVDAGQVILLPATKPHALQAVSRFKMLLTLIRS